MKLSRLSVALILSFGLLVMSSWKSEAKFEWKYLPLNQLHVTKNYSTDLSFLAMGSHRVAADIAYIQFLQYYGSADVSETDEAHEDHGPHDHLDHEDHAEHEKEMEEVADGTQDGLVRPKRKIYSHRESGEYQDLLSYGKRILYLDPFFHAAVLEVGGGLAFNVQRPDEGAEILREALRLDPRFHRYRLYLAAVLYKNTGRDMDLLEALDEAIQFSDCPILLENILANLNKKYGRYLRAAEVYVHIIKTATRVADRESAERDLVALVQHHPELAVQIRPLLEDI